MGIKLFGRRENKNGICPCCGHGKNCTLHICDKDKCPVIIKLRQKLAEAETEREIEKTIDDEAILGGRAEITQLQAELTGAYNRGHIDGLKKGRRESRDAR